MKQFKKLLDGVAARVNVAISHDGVNAGDYIKRTVKPEHFTSFYAFYGLTTEHPLLFDFKQSSLAGTYFLGKSKVRHSILYKSDIRGDELKCAHNGFAVGGTSVPMHDDETIVIRDSFLLKTLVHSFCHDPRMPEQFLIKNTIALNYSNIHGSPTDGCIICPFATIDLTTAYDCIIGTYAYVQTGELRHAVIEPGTIQVGSGAPFSFTYRHSPEVLKKYIDFTPGKKPKGVFMDFVEERKRDFERVFGFLYASDPENVPKGSFVSRYSVQRGNTIVDENVLVAQRAYLQDAWLGKGANAQENCYVVNSRLDGYDVTAHGGKIINAQLGHKVFVGFNSFLRGGSKRCLRIGEDSIVMPHTIIDVREPLEIPDGHLVWGYISRPEDLKDHCIAIDDLIRVEDGVKIGGMTFTGSGKAFVKAFTNRIVHILEANGAYYDGTNNTGHAQKTRNITYNIIQPYQEGEWRGIYPTMRIAP